MMKVLFLAPQPFFESRGTPLNIRNIVTILGEKGFEIDLVTYHIGEDLSIKNVRMCRSAKIYLIKEVKIGPSFIKLFLDVFLFIKAITLCLKNKYRVIHAVEESVYIGLILKKLFKTPLIYDMDSNIPQQLEYSNFIKSKFLLNLAKKIDKFVIKNSDLILTVCSDLTESVSKDFPFKKIFQIEDIHLESNDKKNIKPPEVIKSELGLNHEKVVLYTGNFEDYQGIDFLLQSIPQVVKKIKNVRFVLVGGEEAQIKEKIRIAEDLNVTGWVSFAGKKPIEEMDSYLSFADILASPRTEGTNTPLKIFTYLASGKPIIATKLKTHTQVLNDDVAYLVKPDSDSFAEGIVYLLKNNELCLKLGKNGKKLTNEKYSYKEFSKKIEQVYNFLSNVHKDK